MHPLLGTPHAAVEQAQAWMKAEVAYSQPARETAFGRFGVP